MCFAMRVGLPSGMGWGTDQRHQKHIETGANNKQFWIGRYHFTVAFSEGCSISLTLSTRQIFNSSEITALCRCWIQPDMTNSDAKIALPGLVLTFCDIQKNGQPVNGWQVSHK